MTGSVKKLVQDRGFGFIKGEDGREYFFHLSAMRERGVFDSLKEGDAVTFEKDAPKEGSKGPRAADVVRA